MTTGIWQGQPLRCPSSDGSQEVLSAFLQERPAGAFHQLASQAGHDRDHADDMRPTGRRASRWNRSTWAAPRTLRRILPAFPLHIVAVPMTRMEAYWMEGKFSDLAGDRPWTRSARRMAARFAPERSGVDHPERAWEEKPLFPNRCRPRPVRVWHHAHHVAPRLHTPAMSSELPLGSQAGCSSLGIRSTGTGPGSWSSSSMRVSSFAKYLPSPCAMGTW